MARLPRLSLKRVRTRVPLFPRIGITAARKRGRIMVLLNWLSVLLAGGRPVVLRAGGRPRRLDGLRGFVIGGGDDIDVSLYGGEPYLETRVDPERDSMEMAVLNHAARFGLPVLGICRGAQMINIHQGGSLHQDIYAVFEDAPRRRSVLPRKAIAVRRDSGLQRILKKKRLTVNALHHQAVARLGKDLRVVARDRFGIVQAIEATTAPLRIGVQWHPEMLIYRGRQRGLFQALVAAARRPEAAHIDTAGLPVMAEPATIPPIHTDNKLN